MESCACGLVGGVAHLARLSSTSFIWRHAIYACSISLTLSNAWLWRPLLMGRCHDSRIRCQWPDMVRETTSRLRHVPSSLLCDIAASKWGVNRRNDQSLVILDGVRVSNCTHVIRTTLWSGLRQCAAWLCGGGIWEGSGEKEKQR